MDMLVFEILGRLTKLALEMCFLPNDWSNFKNRAAASIDFASFEILNCVKRYVLYYGNCRRVLYVLYWCGLPLVCVDTCNM